MESIRRLLAENLLVFIIVVASLLTLANSELRFCHKGPQKVSATDCPHGIFFKQPILTKCLYYAQDSDSEGSSQPAVYSSDVCGIADKSLVPKVKLESTVIQKLTYGPNEDGKFVASSGPAHRDPACIQECFDEVDPSNLSNGDEELPEYNFQTASCSPEMLEQQMGTSEKLFDYLLFGQETEAKIPSNHLHQLLERCASILLKHCGEPYIKSAFFVQAQEAIKFLHYKINKSKVLDLSLTDFASIDDRLKQCLNSPKASLQSTGIQCSTKGKIESIKYVPLEGGGPRKLKHQLEPKSFRFGKFDILIEAVWAALDFAHSFCFEEFRNHPYHMDMLVDHVSRVFSIREIEERWYCPHELKNQDFWNNLAGVGDVSWTMRNVDFCAQAAAKASIFHHRLDRTFESDTETPDFVLIGPPTDKKGWNGTEEQYWKVYETVGGVRSVLKASEDGFCPTSKRDLEIFKVQQGMTC